MIDAARLETLLGEAGWRVRPLGDGELACGFGGAAGSFRARVRLTEDRLEIAVGPYVDAPDAARAPALHARLLALNAAIVMARFSLADDGAVFLRVDWPRANLDDSEVRDALDAAAYYAERHHAEIRDLG